MAKQPVNINFAQGLNTKVDPWQVPLGQFLSLKNSVFDVGGQLKKRNGYGNLPSLPNAAYNYLTSCNNNLTAIGQNVAALNQSSNGWVTKSTIQPVSLSTLPLIRNSVNQTQCDAVISTNGLVCTVYTEVNNGVTLYKYAVANSVTGQNIVPPTLIPVGTGSVSGSPRVFLLGSYFVIAFTNLISATSHLQYISISTANPLVVTANQDLASAYIPASTLSWDGVVFNNNLYVAYNTTTGGQAVKVVFLSMASASQGLTPSSATTFSARTATMMSLTIDATVNTTHLYVSFYDLASTSGYAAALDLSLNVLQAPVQIISSGTVLNITSTAQNGVCSVYYEVSNTYGYSTSFNQTNFVNLVTLTGATASSAVTVIRSLGLGSKAFLINSVTTSNTYTNKASFPSANSVISGTYALDLSLNILYQSNGTAWLGAQASYFLGAYFSQFQSSYFLVSGLSTQAAPIISAKLAWENGGGYLNAGLPGVSLFGQTVSIAYLYKDLIEPISTQNNTQQTTTGGVYAQTGINLASFDLALENITSVGIAEGLQIGGGFGWLYDGYLPVEQNFFLYPENVSVSTTASAVTPTGTVTSGSNVITAISSMASVGIGSSVSGTSIPANQFVTSISGSTATFGPLTATGSHTAETITFTGNVALAQQYYYQAVYEWTDNQGNVYRSAGSIPVTVTTTGTTSTNTINIPMIRLTYKTANLPKIVIYRWSAAQPVYYQITSVSNATLNSTTTDSVTFVDGQSDANILGNSIIYTTGGVVEDVNPPATNIMTLFDTRAWLVDAEDPSLLWYSKQVIEATPVEWSDLLTFYLAPNAGIVSAGGPVTALFPMDDKLIIFKGEGNVMYYINGIGPDNTGNPSPSYNGPVFITSTVSCSNPNSIVLIPNGLMFQSSKGIWLLGRDGMSTSYIGAPVERYNSSLVQSAVSIPNSNQVRFTLNTGETLIYDYFFNQWDTDSGAPAISSCINNNLHSFINEFGEVFQETPGVYVDGSNPVLMSFLTGWINLANIQGYQRLYYFYLIGKFLSPHKLNVTVAYDYNPSVRHSTLITPKNFSSAVASPFGDQPAPFGSPVSLEQWKIHAKIQKCQSFQIGVQEIYDPSFNVAPGAGFTLSGINMLCDVKRGSRPIPAKNTAG